MRGPIYGEAFRTTPPDFIGPVMWVNVKVNASHISLPLRLQYTISSFPARLAGKLGYISKVYEESGMSGFSSKCSPCLLTHR